MTSNAAPEWVYKRDGRLVPFESDKISRALFAAGESLGQADAFTARELTDGVVHFLSREADGTVLTTAQIAELVVKVVRELGHPALAQAFAEFTQRHPQGQPLPAEAPRSRLDVPDLSILAAGSMQVDPVSLVRRAGGVLLRAYTLREVLRDLAAAHQEGLLVLGGLEAPFELAGWLLGAPAGRKLIEGLEQARGVTGEYLAIDCPEYALHRAHHGEPGASATGVSATGAAEFARELGIGLRTTGLHAVVNLNSSTPPFWAGELADGPLFAQQRALPSSHSSADIAEKLLALLLDIDSVRVDWHLAERDLTPEADERLQRLVRDALDHPSLTFTFDRPRRPAALAEGIDRQHPAVLMTVGLNLPRLQEQLGQRGGEATDAADVFLQKLGSLARLALSAAVQKRAFLRRHERNWPAFLLERARLVVVPLGMKRREHLSADGEFTRRIVERLREVLDHDGRTCHLDCCLDAFQPGRGVPGDALPLATQQLLRRASHLGTVIVPAAKDKPLEVDDVVGLLREAWRQPEITRLRFLRGGETRKQLLAPWER